MDCNGRGVHDQSERERDMPAANGNSTQGRTRGECERQTGHEVNRSKAQYKAVPHKTKQRNTGRLWVQWTQTHLRQRDGVGPAGAGGRKRLPRVEQLVLVEVEEHGAVGQVAAAEGHPGEGRDGQRRRARRRGRRGLRAKRWRSEGRNEIMSLRALRRWRIRSEGRNRQDRGLKDRQRQKAQQLLSHARANGLQRGR